MTVIITEIWDALKSVGVEDEKARRAAAAVADYRAGLNERMEAGFKASEQRDEGLRVEIAALRQEMRDEIAALRQEMRDEIAALRQEMRDEIAALRQEMRDEIARLRVEIASRDGQFLVLKWMVGSLIALNATVLVKLLFV